MLLTGNILAFLHGRMAKNKFPTQNPYTVEPTESGEQWSMYEIVRKAGSHSQDSTKAHSNVHDAPKVS
jgi:hypothetical protein